MKVFHYTTFGDIGGILGKRRGDPAGLEPRTRIDSLLPELKSTWASFALLEPAPESWVNNPYFQNIWKILSSNLQILDYGALLLELDVDIKNDQVFVGDRAHIEGYLYTDKTGIPAKFLHGSHTAASEAFAQSITPLDAYLKGESEGFSLPEVIITNPIPLERITVSSRQPLIEVELGKRFGYRRQHMVDLIKRGYAQSELLPWQTVYEAQHGPLEGATRNIESL